MNATPATVPPFSMPLGRLWPEDFVPLDEGRLWVRRDFAPVFDSLGWRTCTDVMTTGRTTLIRAIDHRANHRGEIPSPEGGAPVRVYLKRHFGERLRPASFGHVAPRGGVTSGMHEADAVAACQHAGVATMDIIAAGQQPSSKRGCADSFFMSEHLTDVQPAEQYWPLHLAGADGPTRTRRARMLEAMAAIAARLHEHGLFHRDFYWCHFMIGERGGEPLVRLIDLQRLARPRLSSAYARIKDLAQFLVSAPAAPVGPGGAELEAWYRHYRRAARLGARQRVGLTLVRARARLYRLKGLKA